jgi:DHA2 family multidrug resistance protein
MCALQSTERADSAWLMAGIIFAASTDTVNSTLAQVAAPEITGNLAASMDEGAWVTMVYTMGRLFALLAAGRLIERVGLYRTLVACMGANMGLCATVLLGPGLWGVVLCRALQGLAGGAVTVAATAALILGIPRAQHAYAQAGWGVTTMLGPSLLAYLCGAASDAYGWRLAALWQVALALAAMACLWRTLGQREPAFVAQGGNDTVGGLLWGVVVITSQFVAARGTRYNWTDVDWMLPLVAAAGVACFAFVLWHRRVSSGPRLVDTTALQRPEFNFACMTAIASSYGSTASAMLLPLYARGLFGLASADVGVLQLWAVVPTAAGLVLSATATARRWFPAVVLIYTGMALFGGTLVLWSNATWQVDVAFLARVMAIRGFAFGLMAVPTAVVAFSHLQGAGAVHGIGIYQAMRQAGASFATVSLTWRLAETKARFAYALSTHLTPGDPTAIDRLLRYGAHLRERGALWSRAPGAALGQARLALAEQAAILAYNACFLEILYVFGTCMAVALLLRSRMPAAH